MEDKINEYKERHKNWRDISIIQSSNANNILLTLSAGLSVLWFDAKNFTNITFFPIMLCISQCPV